MADIEEGVALIKPDVCISKHPKKIDPNHQLLLIDRASYSSASIRLAKSFSMESELDWKDQSTIDPLQTTSRFLNPSPTKSNALNNTEWEVPSPGRSEPRSKKSTERTRSESVLIMDHHTSASFITTSLEPVVDQDIRSVSGTPIITGIFEALPDVLESRPSLSSSPSRSPKRADILKGLEGFRLELGDLGDYWKSEDSDSGSVCLVSANLSIRCSVLSQSRRGSELLPPNEMWITGGPCPGLYVMKGRAHGRPRWLGAEAQVLWNQEAKAWLLISRNEKDLASALAMLCVNSNNPCVTSSNWRVGKAAKRGISHSFFDTYAFRVDNEMLCTKYIGSETCNKSASSIIRESTVVRIRRGIGVVRFVGPLEDQRGMWAGIELFTPTGLNNGTRNEFFYFEAKPQHGVFVHIPDAIKKVYGRVTDRITTFIDDLLVTTRGIKEMSEAAIERLVRIMIVLGDGESIFCRQRPNVLGIILFYELIML